MLQALQVPQGVRWESGVEAGSEVTPHYDPMLAKLVVHGSEREVARRNSQVVALRRRPHRVRPDGTRTT